jgi:hypothetical protein
MKSITSAQFLVLAAACVASVSQGPEHTFRVEKAEDAVKPENGFDEFYEVEGEKGNEYVAKSSKYPNSVVTFSAKPSQDATPEVSLTPDPHPADETITPEAQNPPMTAEEKAQGGPDEFRPQPEQQKSPFPPKPEIPESEKQEPADPSEKEEIEEEKFAPKPKIERKR